MRREIAVGMAETAPDAIDGTVAGIVFRNDETGYSVLRVTGADDGSFRLKGLSDQAKFHDRNMQ